MHTDLWQRMLSWRSVSPGPAAALLFLLLLFVNGDLFRELPLHSLFLNLAALALFVFGARPSGPALFRITALIVCGLLLVSFRLYTRSTHMLSLLLLGTMLYYVCYGRFSVPGLLVLLLCSGVSDKLLLQFSAEIKQYLCRWAYLSLKDILHIQKQEGIYLWLPGRRISIDTACMGLSMLRTGILCAAALLTLEERRHNRRFAYMQYLLVMAAAVLLVILSNYFRIILLLLSNSTEDGLLHQSVGLASFALYVLLPLYLFFRVLKPGVKNPSPIRISYIDKWLVLLLIPAAFAVSRALYTGPSYIRILEGLNIPGGSWVTPEVYKVQSPGRLTYIKTAAHSPMLCWTGSGYNIVRDFITVYKHRPAHCTVLEKEGRYLYSYWWYENGTRRALTFHSVLLRQLLTGNPARLVNITLDSEEQNLYNGITSAEIP